MAAEEPEKPLVWIVDDDLDFCRVLAEILEESFSTKNFQSATEFRAAFEECLSKNPKSRIPDLLLIDVCMPRIDGVDLLRELRKDRPPVILITGEYSPRVLRQAEEFGVFEVIEKPFDHWKLEVQILRAILDSLKGFESFDSKDGWLGERRDTLQGVANQILSEVLALNQADDSGGGDISPDFLARRQDLESRMFKLRLALSELLEFKRNSR